MAIFTDTEAQHLSVHDALTFSFFPGASVNETLHVSDSLRSSYRAGLLISELIKLHDQCAPSARFKETLHELLTVHPRVFNALKVLVADGLTITEALSVTLAVLVAEHLHLNDVLASTAHLKLSVAERVNITSKLLWFLGGFISEHISVHEAVAPLWRWAGVITENLTVHESFSPRLLVRVALAEHIDLDDETALRAIYHATLSDFFEFSVAFVDPGGGITTWAINTRTSAITEYQNFAFNSFAQMGNHFLGASQSGLYVLDGALDDATSVVARIKSGSAQFSGSRFTSFEAIYLGCRVSDSGRDWVLKLHAGDGREYVYAFRPLNRRTTKIFVGKGLRARYFGWELITAGENFDFDGIEFVPISAKRRV